MGGCGYFHCCSGRVFRSPSKNEVTRDAKTVVDVGVSHGGKAENGENLLEQSINKDSDEEINRSSKVSSQFLPPEGSKTVEVPSENYELRYSYLSQRGYYPDAPDKANQDSLCIVPSFASNPNCHFFGVFDGHGEFGAQCSEFVKNNLSENLLKSSKFHADPAEACHSAFLTTNMQLHLDDVDDSMSGTTAITVLVHGRTLVVANAGDSRAIIAEKRGEDLVAIDLSIDQTPFRPDEHERVKLSGAKVLTLDQIEGLKPSDVQCWSSEEGDDGDPPRLWVQNGMYPGTAFTRSIGDSIAESIGVVANPEIAVLELTSAHPFFIIASDGVFEFLSSQTVVDMVSKFKDPHDACAAIVAESYHLWLQYETRTDDITIIIVYINGLTNASSGYMKPLNHVKELTGSESPTTMSWDSRNNPARHDPSRARVRAIEWSLGNGQTWVPPNLSHRKTWEEEAHIERALQEHFLFRKLSDTLCHVLIDCMQKVDHHAGDIVVHQGEEGDCFYIVGSGEFEVLSSQDKENGEKDTSKVLHRYTADKLSCFGELALMYNKPPLASVRAVTDGILWALKREDFRGILISEFSNLPSLKLLRSVNFLSKLSILQLSHIAGSLLELSFSDGQTIVNQDECITSLYIIQKGQVRLTYKADVIRRGNSSNLSSREPQTEPQPQSNNEHSVIKGERSYFGEWSLLGEYIESFTAVSVGDVTCLVLSKEKFDVAMGSLIKLVHDEYW